jgi:hypothetical protein
MQENYLFEYAVIRVVPRVEREEFLNVGVILYCAKRKFLNALTSPDETKLSVFSPTLDLQEIRHHLQVLQLICCGKEESGPIGKLDMASRFRWLTATRSTVLQTSRVHPGLCVDPAVTLEKLYEQLVL